MSDRTYIGVDLSSEESYTVVRFKLGGWEQHECGLPPNWPNSTERDLKIQCHNGLFVFLHPDHEPEIYDPKTKKFRTVKYNHVDGKLVT